MTDEEHGQFWPYRLRGPLPGCLLQDNNVRPMVQRSPQWTLIFVHLCTPCVNIGAEIHSSDRIIPLILLALAARQPAESGADVGEGAEPEVLDRFAPHEPGIATA